ncbi:MAG: hypothetical protein P4N60_06730 [Verrucomicrobiae bacterium]|nr:hypothetical protein [Verrucomicrobiae bacterium]
MEKLFIQSIRIISYILLPIGSNVTTGAIGPPVLVNILKPIIPTNLAGEIATIIVLIVLPILVIIFTHPKMNDQSMGARLVVQRKLPGKMQKPTVKSVIVDFIAIVVLLVIGILPLIFGAIILLMIIHAADQLQMVH